MESLHSQVKPTIGRPFSLSIYLLVVLALSWPFQIAFLFLGASYRPLLLVSMIMAGVGTYIAGKYVFKDGFENAGWRWGKPIHYLYALGLALFLWLVPSLLELALGIQVFPPDTRIFAIVTTFLLSFSITLLPAFGEEFSWRGYLLPRLLARHSARRALLIHALITWAWHIPFVLVLGMEIEGSPAVTVPVVLAVSLVPTVMHAVVFAYIWSRSQSLAVVTVYHSAFDEVRDTLEGSVGFGPLAQYWQMVVLTVLGIAALWKARWRDGVGRPQLGHQRSSQ